MTKTRVPSDNTGTRREELMCPHCFSPLEKHSVYSEEYRGRASLMKATKCTDANNEGCPYKNRVPPDVMEDVLETQYKSPSIVSRIRQKATTRNISIFIGILVVMLALIGNPLSGGGNTSQTESVQMEVSTPLGQDYNDQVTIRKFNTGEAISSGNIIEYSKGGGRTEITIDPKDERLAKQYARVNFANNKVLKGPSSLNIKNESVEINLDRKSKVRRSGVVSNGFVIFDIGHPENIGDGINITISPPNKDTIRNNRIIESGEIRNINIPGILTTQEAVVEAKPNKQTVTKEKEYDGGTQEINLKGNTIPSELDFNIDLSEESAIRKSILKEIESQGSINASVKSREGARSPKITLFGKMTENKKSIEDEWTGSIRALNIRDGPATVKATMIGNQKQKIIRKNGTSTNDSITLDIIGEETVENVTVNFTGINTENTLASKVISPVNEKIEKNVTEIKESGTYVINFEERGDQEFTSGYYINSEFYPESIRLELEKGDKIRIMGDAKKQKQGENRDSNNPEKDFSPPPQYPLEIESTSVSDRSANKGETVKITSRIKNPKDIFYTAKIKLFRNGNQIKQKTKKFSSGETKQITFNNIEIKENGKNTLSINQGRQITVGTGASPQEPNTQSISGEAAIEVNRIFKNKTVSLDTNRNGEYNCETNPRNGSCTINFLGKGQQIIPIQKTGGISKLSYEYNYTNQIGQLDPKMNLGDRTVLRKQGSLNEGENISRIFQMEEGTHQITFPKNNLNLSYKLKWSKSSKISRPIVDVNGRRIVSSDKTFRGKEYNLNNITNGQNKIKIKEASGNPFYARLSWKEKGDSIAPSIIIDDSIACTEIKIRNNECIIKDLNSKSINLRMRNGKIPINYTLSYTSINTPKKVGININDKTTIVEKTPESNWESIESINSLRPGSNRIKVNSIPKNTKATVKIKYGQRLQNPVRPAIQFLGKDTTKDIEISSSKIDIETQELTGKVTTKIPRGLITKGRKNKDRLEFSNSNDQGGVNITIESNMSDSDSIIFKERG